MLGDKRRREQQVIADLEQVGREQGIERRAELVECLFLGKEQTREDIWRCSFREESAEVEESSLMLRSRIDKLGEHHVSDIEVEPVIEQEVDGQVEQPVTVCEGSQIGGHARFV